MSKWACAVSGMAMGLIGLLLIAVVWRAVYLTDHGAQTTMFTLGMPLVLLSTLVGGLLLRGAGRMLGRARRAPVGQTDMRAR